MSDRNAEQPGTGLLASGQGFLARLRSSKLDKSESQPGLSATGGKAIVGEIVREYGSASNSRRWLVGALFFAPTVLAILYYGLIAADRYVSEASFVVNSARKESIGGLQSFLQVTGITTSRDDAYTVHEYMRSRDAVHDLQQRLPLREIFSRDEADFMSAFPKFLGTDSEVELHDYFLERVQVFYNVTTGISSLRVEAFRPEDAQRIAEQLLLLSEDLVNRINHRMQEDAVEFAQDEVNAAQQRLIEVQVDIKNYRNRELLLDPEKASLAVVERIGELSGELALANTEIRRLKAASPKSPRIATLHERVAALTAQIAEERQQVSGASEGLANKIAEYERLILRQGFLVKSLEEARQSLDTARQESRRQMLYLVHVVRPRASDIPQEPQRLHQILVIALASLLLFFVYWLVRTGVREHATSGR